MKIKLFTLNAFAKSNDGGNPAGVVLDSDNLSEEQMLKIAKKVGFSETAFIQKSTKADFRVRFFTPEEEVNICGHATIATFYLLVHKNIISKGFYSQETKAGILEIEVLENNTIFMDQLLPTYFDIVDKKLISDSLNIPEEYISEDLPIQIVSTGLRDTLVPIKSLEKLLQIKPDLEKISQISKDLDVIGYHVFSRETKFNTTAHCRNFGPAQGIDEESATGTSCGALGCYLSKYMNINGIMRFEQGYSMGKPSEIIANIELNNQKISRVRVGGVATDVQEIEIII